MGYELSLSARREITKKQARAYASASKKSKGEILARLVGEVGWSRANARRQLNVALARRGPAQRQIFGRGHGAHSYEHGTEHHYWCVRGCCQPGQPCGCGQLLKMSAATIDRLLAPHKRMLRPGGKSATRSRKNRHFEAIPIMTHVRVLDWQPGRAAIDPVAHSRTPPKASTCSP